MSLNQDFIVLHRLDDVRRLALDSAPEGVDLKFCLQQIEGWQLARRKLPKWAEREDILYPVRISMEQCSSELTAEYKNRLVQRLFPVAQDRFSFADLTGGFGVDFAAIAPLFQESTYIEAQPSLCALARHNFPLLDLPDAKIFAKGEEPADNTYSLIYLDPSRRNESGRKVVALEDCSPNIVELQDSLLKRANRVIVKLSPMLDISLALSQLRGVEEVHVVGAGGECKELLFVMSRHTEPLELIFHCANLGTAESHFSCSQSARRTEPKILPSDQALSDGYLYEPNACILKGGVQEALAHDFGLQKLHPMSNLYYSTEMKDAVGGLYRCFHIVSSSDFNKKNLRNFLKGITQANLTIRNFPSSVAVLRRKLHLEEGGDVYLFATTNSLGQHILIRTEQLFRS